MQVKTFEALNMRDAVKAVKSEFGQNAVILSTKEKSLSGATGQRTIEVTAAIMNTPSKEHAVTPHLRYVDQTSEGVYEKFDNLDVKLSSFVENLPKKAQINAVESSIEELKVLLLEALRATNSDTIKDVPKAFEKTFNQLKFTGVEASYLAELVGYLRDLPVPEKAGKSIPDDAREYYQSHAIRWMIKRVKIAPRWQAIAGGVGIHAFVGPTGTGKTSLVAKLAAHYKKKDKMKILLVSYDTTRLAAAEQLRIYAKMLDIPFESVDSLDALSDAMQKYQDLDLVLVDTAGRSPKSTNKLNDLMQFKSSALPIDCHLVLSMTDKSSQLDRSVRAFSPMGISSVVFSKLDESWSYGEIFNLTQKWSLPISFFSTGQQIPEDVEYATRERIIERLFSL